MTYWVICWDDEHVGNTQSSVYNKLWISSHFSFWKRLTGFNDEEEHAATMIYRQVYYLKKKDVNQMNYRFTYNSDATNIEVGISLIPRLMYTECISSTNCKKILIENVFFNNFQFYDMKLNSPLSTFIK